MNPSFLIDLIVRHTQMWKKFSVGFFRDRFMSTCSSCFSGKYIRSYGVLFTYSMFIAMLASRWKKTAQPSGLPSIEWMKSKESQKFRRWQKMIHHFDGWIFQWLHLNYATPGVEYETWKFATSRVVTASSHCEDSSTILLSVFSLALFSSASPFQMVQVSKVWVLQSILPIFPGWTSSSQKNQGGRRLLTWTITQYNMNIQRTRKIYTNLWFPYKILPWV